MYTVTFARHAIKGLDALTSKDRSRVQAEIQALADDPTPANSIQMSGSTLRRLRVGTYRVIYDMDDTALTIMIVEVGHRRDVY